MARSEPAALTGRDQRCGPGQTGGPYPAQQVGPGRRPRLPVPREGLWPVLQPGLPGALRCAALRPVTSAPAPRQAGSGHALPRQVIPTRRALPPSAAPAPAPVRQLQGRQQRARGQRARRAQRSRARALRRSRRCRQRPRRCCYLSRWPAPRPTCDSPPCLPGWRRCVGVASTPPWSHSTRQGCALGGAWGG